MSGRWIRPQLLWLAPGLAIGFAASAQAEHHAVGLVPVLLFGIAPHLTVLLGMGQPRVPGRLAARAVPCFNLAHHPLAPLAVLGLGAAGVVGPFWMVGAIAWLGHIVVDWALGDGMRDAHGHRAAPFAWVGEALRRRPRTPLGPVGREAR